MALLKYRSNDGKWTTMFRDFMAAIKNRLRCDKNLNDVMDVGAARENLGLIGDNNHTHYHDDRYLGKIEAESQARNSAVTEIYNSIENLRKNITSISASLDTKINNVQQNVNAQVANLIQAMNQKFGLLEQKINNELVSLIPKLNNSIDEKLEQIKIEFNGLLNNFKNEINATCSTLRDRLDQMGTNSGAQIDAVHREVEKLRNDHDEKFRALEDSLSSATANTFNMSKAYTDNKIQDVINLLNSSIANINTKIDYIDSKSQERDTALNVRINELNGQLNQKDAELRNYIETKIRELEARFPKIFDEQGRLIFPNGNKFWVDKIQN